MKKQKTSKVKRVDRKIEKSNRWTLVKAGLIILTATYLIGYFANEQNKPNMYISPDPMHTATPKPTELPTPEYREKEKIEKSIDRLEQLQIVEPKKEKDGAVGEGVSAINPGVPSEIPTPTPSPTSEPTPIPNPTPEPTVSGEQLERLKLRAQKLKEKQDIKAYIHKIFAKFDPRTAVAVSLAESGTGKIVPGEVVYDAGAEAISAIEHSVGIFQINLYNKDHNVHADRIPGSTMEEKVNWLKDPYNNTLYAFWVFADRENWTAWSVFLNNKFRQFLGE